MPIASYETPKRPLTPEIVAAHGAAPQAARAALAVEWEGPDATAIEAALTEAAHAYDAVTRQILTAHVAAIKATR